MDFHSMIGKLRSIESLGTTGGFVAEETTCNMTAEGTFCPVHGMAECDGYALEECNMTAEGENCPTHGLSECPGYAMGEMEIDPSTLTVSEDDVFSEGIDVWHRMQEIVSEDTQQSAGTGDAAMDLDASKTVGDISMDLDASSTQAPPPPSTASGPSSTITVPAPAPKSAGASAGAAAPSAGAPAASTFDAAFKAARQAAGGAGGVFMWQDKPYQTNVKGEKALRWNDKNLKRVGTGWDSPAGQQYIKSLKEEDIMSEREMDLRSIIDAVQQWNTNTILANESADEALDEAGSRGAQPAAPMTDAQANQIMQSKGMTPDEVLSTGDWMAWAKGVGDVKKFLQAKQSQGQAAVQTAQAPGGPAGSRGDRAPGDATGSSSAEPPAAQTANLGVAAPDAPSTDLAVNQAATAAPTTAPTTVATRPEVPAPQVAAAPQTGAAAGAAAPATDATPPAPPATGAAPAGEPSFKDAFAKARKAAGGGQGVFTWKGKQYQTNIKGEPFLPTNKLKPVQVSEEDAVEEDVFGAPFAPLGATNNGPETDGYVYANFNEGLTINTTRDMRDGKVTKTLNITATDEEAESLASLLRNAGLGMEVMAHKSEHGMRCDGCGLPAEQCHCAETTMENADHDYGHDEKSEVGEPLDVEDYIWDGPHINQRFGKIGDNTLMYEQRAGELFKTLSEDYAAMLNEADLEPSNAGFDSPLTANSRDTFDKDPFVDDKPVTDGSHSPLSTVKRQDVMN